MGMFKTYLLKQAFQEPIMGHVNKTKYDHTGPCRTGQDNSDPCDTKILDRIKP